MSLSKCKITLIYIFGFVPLFSAVASSPDEMSDKIATLEARLAKLEARLLELEEQKRQNSDNVKTSIEEFGERLAEAEQKAEIAEQLATENALVTKKAESKDAAAGISRNIDGDHLLWTQKKQWDEIKPGVSMKKVIELLGPPFRSLDSLKPRVDEVFYYQTSLRLSSGSLRGKVSFRKGEVIAVEKPDFEQTASNLN